MSVFSPIYSIPYLLAFFALFLMWRMEASRIGKHQSVKGIHVFVFILLLLFIGLRGFIYTDWVAYYPTYEQLSSLSLLDWDKFLPSIAKSDYDWESGFLLYSLLLKSTGLGYHGWIFASTLIDLCIIGYLFKKHQNCYVLAFAVFFIYGGFGMEVNLMRNAKAIMLFLLSVPYIWSKKFLPYLIRNLIGSSFHVSALLYIPLYFVLSQRISKKIYWTVFTIGNVVFLLHQPIATTLLMPVIDLLGGRGAAQLLIYASDNTSYGITIGYLERVFMFVLFMLFYDRLQKEENMYVFLNMYLLYFFFFFYFSEFSVICERVATLFIPAYWFLLPALYSYLAAQKYRICFCSLLLLYGTMKIVSANNNILSRYDNLLFGIESYEERSYTFSRYATKIFDNQ